MAASVIPAFCHYGNFCLDFVLKNNKKIACPSDRSNKALQKNFIITMCFEVANKTRKRYAL